MPILTVGAVQSINLGLYENGRRWLSVARPEVGPVLSSGVAGSAAGLCISVVTCPLSRIKVLQQLSGTSLHATLRAAAASGTLYSGFGPTATFETSRGIYMASYVVLKRALAHDEQAVPLWARSAAGAGANVICWGIMYPVDVVRSVMQSTLPASLGGHATLALSGRAGALEVVRHLHADGGWRRFYRGFWPTMLRAGPVAGTIMPTFELTLTWLEQRFGPRI